MLDAATVSLGDVVRVTAEGAPGYAAPGDLLLVVATWNAGLTVQDRYGVSCDFPAAEGTRRLERTAWHGAFPETESVP